MEIGLSLTEGAILHGLLAETAGDIVIKLDARGFIEHASPNITKLGIGLDGVLVPPHVADIACPRHADALREFIANALLDAPAESEHFEFPIVSPASAEMPAEKRWHSLSLRTVENDDGCAKGALGLLRSIERRRVLENELHARATTDSLTGLANRKAFCTTLRRQLDADRKGVLALFEIDRFRAIFLQYGQVAADEMLRAFAQFLDVMIQQGCELARLDGGRFAVLLPGMTTEAARTWCEDVLETFAALAIGSTPLAPQLSASAGLTSLEIDVDHAFKQAELALVMARASGGMRVGLSGEVNSPVVFRERPIVSELGASFAAR